MYQTNLRFKQFETVREVASFFLGILAIESRYTSSDEKGEAFWISKFESYITSELNQELNDDRSPDNWTETIGTSYANYIVSNQSSDDEGMRRFYAMLRSFFEAELGDE